MIAKTCDNGYGVYVGWVDGYTFGRNTSVGSVDGLNDFVVTIEMVDGAEKKSSNELVFYGWFYDYLKQQLVDSNNKNAKVEIGILDECCKDENGHPTWVYYGYVYANAITWCSNNCSISANIIQKKIDDDLETCFANTMIWDNDYQFQNDIIHPKIEYCLDYTPKLLHYIVISLVITLLPMLGLLRLITSAVDSVIIVVCALASCSDDLKNGITDDLETMEAWLVDWAVGCGKYHPAPFVRDYIQNVCKICGNRILGYELPFRSSILNNGASDYYYLVMLSNQIHGGEYYQVGGIWGSDAPKNWIDDDRPINSGSQFLDRLKLVFNADWQIINNVLVFERKDYFKQYYGFWIDFTDETKYDIIGDGYCISWLDTDVPSYLNISYATDTVEIEGQRRMPNYHAIVEWNPDHNTVQKGEKKVVFDFGSASFADGSDFFAPMRNDGVKGYLNLFGADSIPEDTLLLSQDTCQYDKLLIIDNGTFLNGELQDPEMEHVKIRKWPRTIYDNELPDSVTRQNEYGTHDIFPDPNQYNYPMQINPRFPNNLYTNFHYIDEPWQTVYKQKSVEVTVLANCDMITTATARQAVNTPYGEMQVDKLEINFRHRTIKITGKI